MCFCVFCYSICYTHTFRAPPPPILKAVSRLSRGGRPLDEAVSRGWKELPLFVSGTKGVITPLFRNNKSALVFFYLLAELRLSYTSYRIHYHYKQSFIGTFMQFMLTAQ